MHHMKIENNSKPYIVLAPWPANPPVLRAKNSRIFCQKYRLVLFVFFGCYGRPWLIIFVESSNGVR